MAYNKAAERLLITLSSSVEFFAIVVWKKNCCCVSSVNVNHTERKKNVVIMQPLGIERVRDEEKEILTSVWWANFWILCNLNLASFISNSFCPVSFLENTSGLTFQSARTFSYWGASCFFPMSHISERGLRLGEGEEAKSWRFAFLYLIFFFVCLFLFLLFLFCYFNWVDGYLCERISQLLFDPMTEN